jgi:hypothetical protein
MRVAGPWRFRSDALAAFVNNKLPVNERDQGYWRTVDDEPS